MARKAAGRSILPEDIISEEMIVNSDPTSDPRND